MYLYHGSNVAVTTVDYNRCRTTADFGTGFYTTNIKEQAIAWAKRKAIDDMGENYNPDIKAVVTTFNLDNSMFKDKEIKYKCFHGLSTTWLHFVRNNLQGESFKGDNNINLGYDLVSGSVASAELMALLDNYEKGLIDKATFKMYLKSTEKTNQYSFHSSISEKYLKLYGHEYFDITKEEFDELNNIRNCIELKFLVCDEKNGVSQRKIVLNLNDIFNNKIQ